MIVVLRRHDLGLARVKRLAETIARRLQNDYFRRTGAAGRVTVTKDSFQVRVELGFLLGALHSRIEREVRAFCDEHFGEEGRGEPTRSTTRRRGARGSDRAK